MVTRLKGDNGAMPPYIHLGGKLFNSPQVATVNGVPYRVSGTRTIAINACKAKIHVAETRVPGPEDPRNLGIIVDGFK